jgi:peptidoglycan/LPS O-acetylase OafA/YrhL
MPGLDGLRAIAVLAVIAYHLGFGWASGGMLGVGVFFTLSGYLITDVLLSQWSEGRLRLGDFWLRRARRLLPALFVMLTIVSIWVAISDRARLHDLRFEVASAAWYVNNWWQIFHHQSYFARFGPPSPLGHLWSLAVEEQFYLIWPFLLLLGVRFIPERARAFNIRPRLAVVTFVLALASAIEMALLYQPTFDASRIYDGTDTRAFGLLFGAALAMVWPSRALTRRVTPRAVTILDVLGVVGLLTIAVLIWRTTQYSAFVYRGGIVLLSLATVLVVAVAAHPATRVGRALGVQPLRWIGVRSYGIYLWHQPIIVLTTPALAHGHDPLRVTAQVAATFVIAALSWRYVEEPVRRGALGRFLQRVRSEGWRPRSLSRETRVALVVTVVALILASVALAGVKPPGVSSSASGQMLGGVGAIQAAPASSQADGVAIRNTGPLARGSLRSSCRGVVHIGDSTSEGLTSPRYLPDPRQRMGAQYARVGVAKRHFEISGATSIVETLQGGINAYEVAQDRVRHGYRGCWVLALGTNDTADVSVGSGVSRDTRIRRMMYVLSDFHVLWVNVKSLRPDGPYSAGNMRLWNQALKRACSTYPNMRIYDWASVVKNRWFIPDGIHYYSQGYASRAYLIANALAKAFLHGKDPSRGCMVRTKSLSVPVHK